MMRFPGVRVAVVEDETVVAMMVEDIIAEFEAVVAGTASSIASARRLFAETEFDVALLDMNLNGERSDPLVEDLKARGKPFVIATGYSDANLGGITGAAILRKPYRAEQIAAALAQALGRADVAGA